jgi:4-hydroxy-tetrahydrodipicolinate reductase
LIINGAGGRTGSRVCALALSDDTLDVVAALTRAGSARVGAPAPGAAEARKPLVLRDQTHDPADVVIDVSSDDGARRAIEMALERRAGLLIATTGLSDQTRRLAVEASEKIPVILAPNTSTGVAATAEAARRIARALGGGCDAWIVEAHHAGKKDAPSGTALRLAEALRDGGGTIGAERILSIRAGDIIGEHTVRFVCRGEEIVLTHRAMTRDVFALGALRAAKWLHGRSPGMWTMEDVLSIERAGG